MKKCYTGFGMEQLTATLAGEVNNYNPTLALNEETNRPPYKKEYEFPREKISLQVKAHLGLLWEWNGYG